MADSQLVRDYLMKKYGIVAGNDEELQQAQDDANQRRLSADIGTAGSNIGAAIAGTKADNSFYDNMRQGADQSVRDLQLKRKNAMDDMALMQSGTKEMQADEDKARDEDMSSNETMTYQTLATKMIPGQDFSQMSAAQIKRVLPSLEKIADMDMKNKSLAEQAKYRMAVLADTKDRQRMAAEERETTKQEKRDIDARERTTQYGIARTADDAKQLKAAGEIKDKFDSNLQEMIDLRKEYGAEWWNSDAVERGQQLSRDLLLAYKDLSKLGVLSKADEAILNAIIPKDPLEWKAASLKGQDPVMHRMTKFKEDTNRDFQTRLKNRLENAPVDQPETKVINGKTYKKVQGGWEEM